MFSGQFLKGNSMVQLRLHNGRYYALRLHNGRYYAHAQDLMLITTCELKFN